MPRGTKTSPAQGYSPTGMVPKSKVSNAGGKKLKGYQGSKPAKPERCITPGITKRG